MLDTIKNALKKNKIAMNTAEKIGEKAQKRRLAKRVDVIKKHGDGIVVEIEDMLSDSGLTYFATCGTLLGLIREGHLLRNDYDMDYGILIYQPSDWIQLEETLNAKGYRKIRDFTLDGLVTEQTYRNKLGVEIDFFGHFIIEEKFCFYSYDKIQDYEYPSEDLWTAYILTNGKYMGVKTIETEIGKVTVPMNAEEYLTYNYNDNWRIPDPNFKANTGKGCKRLENRYGKIGIY